VKPEVDVSVLVVNYNTAHLLAPMFDALNASTGNLHVESILVDNASRDGSVAHIQKHYGDLPLIINSTNVGFGRANNQCLPLVHGRYVLLLNTDAFLAPDTLQTTVGYMDQHPEVGITGVRLVGRDGDLQPCCRRFPTPLNVFLNRTGLSKLAPWVPMVDNMDWDHQSIRECDWVPGCYYLIRREVVDAIGLFDPRYFLYCEEVDHCKRTKQAGWKVTYHPETTVVHIGGESAKSDSALTGGRQISVLQTESELLYFRKHHGKAGVWGHLLLSLVGDSILSTKNLLKGRGMASLTEPFANSSQVIKLFKATKAGTHATR
jgi:N-acetylglucosaminyl-diphospho-decaprenol L-rhamnosyltransferase